MLNFFARRSADWRSGTDSDCSSDHYDSMASLNSVPEIDHEHLKQLKSQDRRLNSKWNVFYLRNDAGADWDDRLVKVTSFETILEFWAVYHYLKLPNQLQAGCDYMIFRDGIKPEWTDPNNESGGRWLMEIDRRFRNEQLNDKWLETLLAVIGEQLEPESNCPLQVCGAIVQSRRKVDRVGIWTRNAEDGDIVMEIGTKFASKIRPQMFQRLRYQSHKSTQVRTGSQQTYQHEI